MLTSQSAQAAKTPEEKRRRAVKLAVDDSYSYGSAVKSKPEEAELLILAFVQALQKRRLGFSLCCFYFADTQ